MSQEHPPEAVEKHYLAALQIGHSQQSKAMELRAALRAAKLGNGANRPAEALERLSTILSQFTEGLDTADLSEAKAVLDRHHS